MLKKCIVTLFCLSVLALSQLNSVSFAEEIEKNLTINPGQHLQLAQLHKSAGDISQAVLFPIRENDLFGFIDATGNLIIHPQFDYTMGFTEGLAAVKVGDDWGYINRTGTYIIQPQFEEAFHFSEGFALVKDGMDFSYINRSGDIVFGLKFDGAGYYVSGDYPGYMMCVYNQSDEIAESTSTSEDGSTSQSPVNPASDPERDVAMPFSEGLAAVNIGGSWGYINTNGTIVIQSQYAGASFFSEGLATVRIGKMESGRYVYIDGNGRTVIDPQRILWAWEFTEGLAGVLIDDKWGYIDQTGDIVIEPSYDSVRPFSDGLAVIQIGEEFAYINTTGVEIFDRRFDYATDFREGFAWVYAENKCYYINTSGEEIFEKRFDGTRNFINGLGLVIDGEQWGYINTDGEYVWGPITGDPPLVQMGF